MSPKISIIAAIGKNRALGKNNHLLWKISSDLRRFRRLTTGHVVIMGRKTFESIGRPLPNRLNIVLTSNPKFSPKSGGVMVVHSVKEALEEARKHEKDEIFIIGGGRVYKEFLPYTNKLYLTIVEDSPDADTFFPPYENIFKTIISQKKVEEKGISYTFFELTR